MVPVTASTVSLYIAYFVTTIKVVSENLCVAPEIKLSSLESLLVVPVAFWDRARAAFA